MSAREKAIEELAHLLVGAGVRPTNRATLDALVAMSRKATTPEGGDSEGHAKRAHEERIADVRAVFDLLGLVAVEPAILERVRAAHARWEDPGPEAQGHGPGGPFWTAIVDEFALANAALADSILAQVQP